MQTTSTIEKLKQKILLLESSENLINQQSLDNALSYLSHLDEDITSHFLCGLNNNGEVEYYYDVGETFFDIIFEATGQVSVFFKNRQTNFEKFKEHVDKDKINSYLISNF